MSKVLIAYLAATPPKEIIKDIKVLHPTVAYIQVDVIPLSTIVSEKGTIDHDFTRETEKKCYRLAKQFKSMGYYTFVNKTGEYGECQLFKPKYLEQT